MKRRKKWLFLLIAAIVFTMLPASVFGDKTGIRAEDKTLAPYFFVEGGDPSVDQFPLKETQVEVNINGVIADIYVTQTYANDGTKPINARYVFPASTRASVHGMKMQIGDKVVTAKVKEREEAKQEFEQAKTDGKSASLLEEQRPNVFTMSVANIMPQDVVLIELHYTELIIPTDGTYQFVFPTVVGPRYSNQLAAEAPEQDKWVASSYIKDGNTPPGKYDITINVSTGVPFEELVCKSHKVDIEKNGKTAAKVTLASPKDYAGNRDFILDYKLTGKEIQCGLMLYEGEKENFFMLMVQPPERVKPEDIPPREYIFVLDVSGSMDGYPLDTAKDLIRNLVTHLRDTDKFNLVLFAGASELMSTKSVSATKENVRKAIELIDKQNGGGGTELSPALESALAIPRNEGYSRSVAVITDGYIDNEKSIFNLISKNIDHVNFFSFGIGTSVNRYLIEGIAKAGLGEPFIATGLIETSQTADRFREYIQSPVLTDINVKYEGFDTYDIEPPLLPTMFAQRPIILFGKWRGEPSGTVQVSGKTGNKDYTQTVKISKKEILETNSAISYLWARSRVARLLDYGIGDENVLTRQEVVDIGLAYHMLTPYTSFIAVIDVIRNKEGAAIDVNQPLPLPLNVSNLAVGGYTQGSEPEIFVLVIGALLIMLVVIINRKRKRPEQ